jgi:hypothetical protein
MPHKNNPLMQAVSSLGRATQTGDPERILKARQQLSAVKLERAIVADGDTLNDADRTRLIALLANGGK